MMGQLNKVVDRFVFEEGEMTMTRYALNSNNKQKDEWQAVYTALNLASECITELLDSENDYDCIATVFGTQNQSQAQGNFTLMRSMLQKWAKDMTTQTDDQKSLVWVDDSLDAMMPAEADAQQSIPTIALQPKVLDNIADCAYVLIHESAHAASTKIIDLAYKEDIMNRLPGVLRLRNADTYRKTVQCFMEGKISQFQRDWALQVLTPGEKALLAAQVFMNMAWLQAYKLFLEAKREASWTGTTRVVMVVGDTLSGTTTVRAKLQSAHVTIWPILQRHNFAGVSWMSNPITQDELETLKSLFAPVFDLNKAIREKKIGSGKPSQGKIEFGTGDEIFLNITPNNTCEELKKLIIQKLVTVKSSSPVDFSFLEELVGLYYKLRQTPPVSFA
jgi:hypothetical protein